MSESGPDGRPYRRIRRGPGKDASASREVDDEIRFHLEEKRTRLIAGGMSEDEADAEAQRRFGDVEEVRKEMVAMTNQRQDKKQRRDMWGDLRQDIRFARRHLFRSPLFTVVAALTLALGIGATTAVYSVVDGILLSPLAFDDPDELVTIWADYTRREGPLREWLSFENFHDLTSGSATLEAAAVYGGGGPTLTGIGEPQQVPEATFSPGMFSDVLRVTPAMGRLFDEREEAPGGPGAVLLSHGLWQRAFGGDPKVLGRTISLNDQPVTVVGVMAEDFRPPFLPRAQMWRPAQIDPADPPCGRGCVFLRAVGRIADGATVEQFQAEATSIGQRLEQAYPADNTGVGFYINPLQDDIVANSSRALWVLLGSVGFVLLVACVNVANLLLSRASSRRSELAVRSALGAGSPRIFRQLLTENLMLAAIGGAAGLLLGFWATDMLVSLAPAGTPRIDEVGMDMGVLGAVAAVTIGAGLLFGTVPARRSSRRALSDDLREGGRGSSGGQARLRNVLVVVQVALALMLTTGAGLLVRSFSNLRTADLGFTPEGVTTFALGLPNSRYPDREAMRGFYRDLETRIGTIPSVSTVGSVSSLPLSGFDGDVNFNIDGQPLPQPGQERAAWLRRVTTGYLATMGIELLDGRGFIRADEDDTQRVVIVNRNVAERLFAGQSPVGERVNFGDPTDPDWWEIIGVAENVRNFGVREDSRLAMYIPFGRVPTANMFLTVKSDLPTDAVAAQIRQIVADIDPALAMATVQGMDETVSASLASDRFTTVLLASFAGLALLLALVGIYGVLSYTVSSRTSEMGLRIALGGTTRDVSTLVVGKSLALVAGGIGAGILGSLLVTRTMSALLYGVSPADPLTLGGVSLLLSVVGLGAAVIPALRAGRVDPVSVLKAE